MHVVDVQPANSLSSASSLRPSLACNILGRLGPVQSAQWFLQHSSGGQQWGIWTHDSIYPRFHLGDMWGCLLEIVELVWADIHNRKHPCHSDGFLTLRVCVRNMGVRSVHRKAWAKPTGAPTERQGSASGKGKHTGQVGARRTNSRGPLKKRARHMASWRLVIVGTFSPEFGAENSGPWILPTCSWPAAPPPRPLAQFASPKSVHDLRIGVCAPSNGAPCCNRAEWRS